MIPVNEPVVSKKSKKYVNDALDTAWISSAGSYVDQFERQFASFIGTKYATTTSNGTTALHLAVESLGIGPGDEVIMPDLTIISCPFAVMYAGATPVTVDVDSTTGNIDPTKIEAKITPKTKAIMVVHLYGHPADMDAINNIAKKHRLFVIEDAAEAHGAEYKGKKAGSLGDIAIFSFYGNKIVTSGEGGMVVTNSKKFIDKARAIKNLAHTQGKRFHHQTIGYNYRLTNVQAAIGVGELKNIDKYLAKKRWMKDTYHKLLKDIPYLTLPSESKDVTNVYWMYNILITPDSPISRDALMKLLSKNRVQTRTYFYPLHAQPIIKKKAPQTGSYPVTNDLSKRGLYLPSGLALTKAQITKVSEEIHHAFKQK